MIFGEVADFRDVAGMEEYVGFGEGEAVGMGCVGERAESGGVGVGDDEKAGTDDFWGHDGVLRGLAKKGM